MYLTRNVLRKYYAPDNGGAGGGGGGSGGAGGQGGGQGSNGGQGGATPPAIPAELQPVVQAMIDAAVAPLKAKNNEIIGEKRTLQTQLQAFEGIEPDAVRQILKRFADDEEAGLIKAGKIDEVLNKRTERLSKDWQKKLEAAEGERKKLEAKANKLAQRATSEAIMKAASKSGALPEAMEDIVLRAQGAGWTINDDGDVVALRDGEVVIGKDGKTALTLSEWTDELRNVAPHLWPQRQGSGASGSNHNSGRAGVDLSKLSPEARLTYAREHGMATKH